MNNFYDYHMKAWFSQKWDATRSH